LSWWSKYQEHTDKGGGGVVVFYYFILKNHGSAERTCVDVEQTVKGFQQQQKSTHALLDYSRSSSTKSQ
jgi:hypothetical protein